MLREEVRKRSRSERNEGEKQQQVENLWGVWMSRETQRSLYGAVAPLKIFT